jgi:DNA primase
MPRKKSEEKELLTILREYSPKEVNKGQIRMMCPFRDNHKKGDGQMSFFMSPDIGAYHCFSCGAKGSLIKLLTTHFGVNYFEAVKLVKLTEYKKKTKHFELDIMWEEKPPQIFLDRGFTTETLRIFRLGVTDDGWVIIPFYSNGELVGFQKRKDFPERITVNSVDFRKEVYLYNQDHTKDEDYIIVVEGYSDCMRLTQLGFNCVAVLGADISSWQAEKISEYKTVYSAFDNDGAGLRATELLYHQIKYQTNVLIVPYLTKDPADVKSKRVWKSCMDNATSYTEYSMEMSIHNDEYLKVKQRALKDLEKRKLTS